MEKYRPSSVAEGDIFMREHCFHCAHYDGSRTDSSDACLILLRTLLFSLDDEEYPQEFLYDHFGQPTCTRFKTIQKKDHS